MKHIVSMISIGGSEARPFDSLNKLFDEERGTFRPFYSSIATKADEILNLMPLREDDPAVFLILLNSPVAYIEEMFIKVLSHEAILKDRLFMIITQRHGDVDSRVWERLITSTRLRHLFITSKTVVSKPQFLSYLKFLIFKTIFNRELLIKSHKMCRDTIGRLDNDDVILYTDSSIDIKNDIALDVDYKKS